MKAAVDKFKKSNVSKYEEKKPEIDFGKELGDVKGVIADGINKLTKVIENKKFTSDPAHKSNSPDMGLTDLGSKIDALSENVKENTEVVRNRPTSFKFDVKFNSHNGKLSTVLVKPDK